MDTIVTFATAKRISNYILVVFSMKKVLLEQNVRSFSLTSRLIAIEG